MFFTNAEFRHWCTEGFICNFLGIECWHPHENKVLNIKLADLGLKGQFPRGVQNCTSLTGLDLSYNNLNGPIPDDVDKLIHYITSIDLSSNSFSGEIPKNISNCTFLNVLKLDNNKFSGQIPPQLGQLSRIKTFSLTNNQLSGPIPVFTSNDTIGPDSFANNPGLCGPPYLESCKASPRKSMSLVRVIESNGVVMMIGVGFGVGFVVSFSYFIFQ